MGMRYHVTVAVPPKKAVTLSYHLLVPPLPTHPITTSHPTKHVEQVNLQTGSNTTFRFKSDPVMPIAPSKMTPRGQ